MKVIKDYEKFLVNELIQDIQEIREERAELRYIIRLKEKLLDHFGEEIQFTKIKNKNVLHSSNVSPLTYTEATLKGHGLREDDIAKVFANLIRRRLSAKKGFEKICRCKPPTPSEFLRSLNESKSLSCPFNAILWSINPRHRKYNVGYEQAPSSAQVGKISMVAEIGKD